MKFHRNEDDLTFPFLRIDLSCILSFDEQGYLNVL